MTTKIIVHKFETPTNFKSLRVTIDDNGNEGTRYSDWAEGEIYQNKKNGEKSRLIIKLFSGDEVDMFNLDLCAKSIKDLEALMSEDSLNDHKKYLESNNTRSKIAIDNQRHNKNISDCASKNFEGIQKFHIWKREHGNKLTNNIFDTKSPLEYSLARVKENNARIMENIVLLNRTLDYAKKREMLEATCPKTMKSYPCATCGKCFVYETGLKRHCAIRHAVLEALPRWQDVWTCVECYQVWPRKDVAIEHTKSCCKEDHGDYNVREIKTSSLLQCEFCEKIYTSIPRLLKHMKIHTTVNNYECNACEMTFLSYKEAEQHWNSCSWLKLCYNFCLPKLLLCNACDRKFRNYEHLYIHRYKAGHFITKTHNKSSINKSLGILVYQCEICAMWFPFISSLKTHRNQCHPMCDSGLQIKLHPYWEEAQENSYSHNTDEIINVV